MAVLCDDARGPRLPLAMPRTRPAHGMHRRDSCLVTADKTAGKRTRSICLDVVFFGSCGSLKSPVSVELVVYLACFWVHPFSARGDDNSWRSEDRPERGDGVLGMRVAFDAQDQH